MHRIVPFDPEWRCRDAQEVEATREPVTVREREFRGRAREVIAKHIAQRAIRDRAGEVAGTGDSYGALRFPFLRNQQRGPTLRYTIEKNPGVEFRESM